MNRVRYMRQFIAPKTQKFMLLLICAGPRTGFENYGQASSKENRAPHVLCCQQPLPTQKPGGIAQTPPRLIASKVPASPPCLFLAFENEIHQPQRYYRDNDKRRLLIEFRGSLVRQEEGNDINDYYHRETEVPGKIS